MPSLNAMRQLEPEGDATSQPLGPPIRQPAPIPMPDTLKKTGTPGVFERSDGKLETRLPEPPKCGMSKEMLRADLNDSANKTEALKLPQRKPKVGDWVRILSGQPGHAAIAALVGTVVPITSVFDGDSHCNIEVPGKWLFSAPGSDDGTGHLLTEFAEAPR